MAAVDITIASEVHRAISDSNYPATVLIAVLLQYIGATTSAFGRDVQTAGQVFHRALTVYNGIRALMAKVDQSSEAAPDWASFDAYTSAIPKLEKRVLSSVFRCIHLIYIFPLDFFSNFTQRTLTTKPEASFHRRMTSRMRSALSSDGNMTALCSTNRWKTWRMVPSRSVSRLSCQYMMIIILHRTLPVRSRRKYWRIVRIRAQRTIKLLSRPSTTSSGATALLIGIFYSKVSFNASTTPF